MSASVLLSSLPTTSHALPPCWQLCMFLLLALLPEPASASAMFQPEMLGHSWLRHNAKPAGPEVCLVILYCLDSLGSKTGLSVELQVNCATLANASEHWKARLMQWLNAANRSSTDTAHSELCMLEEAFDSTAEVEAACAVLQYVTTGGLPSPATVPLLMQMAIVADKWGMPEALSMYLKAAATAKQLSVDDINTLLGDWPRSIQAHSQYQLVIRECRLELLRMFGNAQQVFMARGRLHAFCCLNLRAVQLWSEQDELQVDSENSICALTTHWWYQNKESFSQEQATTACAALTNNVCISNFTRLYVSVVEKLPWFTPGDKPLHHFRGMQGVPLHRAPPDSRIAHGLPEGWYRPPRPIDNQQICDLQCVFTRAEVEQLVFNAAQGPTVLHSQEALYLQGYKCGIALGLHSSSSELVCLVYSHPALPQALEPTKMHSTFAAALSLSVHTGSHSHLLQRDWKDDWPMLSQFVYCAPLCGRSDPSGLPFPLDGMWVDGKLHLHLSILLGDLFGATACGQELHDKCSFCIQ